MDERGGVEEPVLVNIAAYCLNKVRVTTPELMRGTG